MTLPDNLIIDTNSLPDKPLSRMNPAPFDVDTHFNEWNGTKPVETMADNRSAFSKTVWYFARPFLAQGYNAASALNRGIASFSSHLDNASDYVAASTGMKAGGVFEEAAKIYNSNADYWRKRAEAVGINFFDEIISEAVGGFVPGVSQFVLDVESALTLPYMDGAIRAYQRGDSPFVGGMVDAAKTGTLQALFSMMAPLKTYLKAPAMGTVFGVEAAAEAPEGQKARAFGKGMGIGLAYSLASPGGNLGLNEIIEGVKPRIEAKRLEVEAAPEAEIASVSIEKAPEIAPQEAVAKEAQARKRKFLKTAFESPTTMEPLAEEIMQVEPQDYVVQPNAESMVKAQNRIGADGIDATVDYLKSNSELNAEKGATFIEAMNRFQQAGDFDRAIEVVEAYDSQLREAGRFVQAASIWNRLTPAGFIRWAEKQLAKTRSKYGWADTLFKKKPESFILSKDEKADIFKRMTEINKMPDGIEKTDATLQVIDMVAQKVPPSVSELFDAYRYQNMLSGPRTQERNIGENLINTFITRPMDITTRGAIDYIKAGLFGKDRENYINELPVYLKTAVNSVPNAVKAFMQVMRAEKGMEIGKPEVGVEVKSEFERARFKQIPASLTMVTRFMEATDKFFSAIIGAGEFAIQKKKGMPDAEAYRRANEISQKYLYREKLDPNDPDLSYFSKVLSSVGKMINESRKLPGLGTLSKWYVPFIRTPINKGIQMIEHSPLGIARSKINPDIAAQIINGTILTAVGAMFAYENKTTWTPPSDPKEKELFYASGRKAFSVQIGDKWIPVWYLGPFALAFALPAAVKYYAHDRKQAITQSGMEKLLDIAAGTAKFVGSQTSTQSIGALFQAIGGDVDFTFPATTAFTLEQVIPAQGLVRYVGTIIDPVYRKPTGFMEQIEKDLPFLSKGLEARKTPFYEDATRDTTNYFLPYDIGTKDERYEVLLPMAQFEARQKSIQNKMNNLVKKIQDGKIDPSDAATELGKIFNANMKSIEMFGE